MAVRLSALRTGHALSPETLFFCFWYSFPLEAQWIPWPNTAGRIKSIEKNPFTSSGLEHVTFRLVTLSLNNHAITSRYQPGLVIIVTLFLFYFYFILLLYLFIYLFILFYFIIFIYLFYLFILFYFIFILLYLFYFTKFVLLKCSFKNVSSYKS
jgi:hypothetical protein